MKKITVEELKREIISFIKSNFWGHEAELMSMTLIEVKSEENVFNS